MENGYTSTFISQLSPEKVTEQLLSVRSWWSGLFDEAIEGESEKVGDEFTFTAGEGVHFSKQKLVELVPGKKIVWLVTDSNLSFVAKVGEWTGTKIGFEIEAEGLGSKVKFTHEGLVPQFECYGGCTSAWTQYLEKLTGKPR